MSHKKNPIVSNPEITRRVLISKNIVNSQELLGELKKVRINHDSEEYELRITRQGKLLLTK